MVPGFQAGRHKQRAQGHGRLYLVGNVVFDAELADARSHADEVKIVSVNFEHLFPYALDIRLSGTAPRPVENLVGSAVLVDVSVVHEEDAGAHVAGELHLMGYDQHCHSLLGKLAHDAQDLSHHRGIQCRRGLVEEYDFGIHGQAARNRHPLFLAAGKAGGADVRLFGHADLPEQRDGLFARLLPALSKYLDGSVHHVFQHRHMVKEVEPLEHHAHFPAELVHGIAFRKDVITLEQDFAACGRIQQVERTQEGALSGARRADNADYFSFLYGAVDVFEHREGAPVRVEICFAEMVYGNHSACVLGVASFISRPRSQARRK